MVEVVIGSAIVLLVVGAAVGSFATFMRLSTGNTSYVQAGFLLDEGAEAIRFIRDNGWTSKISVLTPGNSYYFFRNQNGWQATTTPEWIDGKFLRSFSVSNVSRNGSDNISSSGAVDLNTKKVTISVSWLRAGATTTMPLSLFITNIFNN